MHPANPDTLSISGATPLPSWRDSNWLIFAEFAVVALISIADLHHLIPLSKTPLLLALGWISLRIRKKTWREIGFTRNQGWGKTLTLGIVAGLLLEVFQLFVTQPILVHFTRKAPDLTAFAILKGNLKYTLLAIAFAWTFAALGEELVWRGYLMNRFADLFKRTRLAWIFSLLLVNVAFGMEHSYQGLTGIIEESIAGLFLAFMYMRTGRNLAIPILAHGTSDTLDAILLFLGKYPGT